MYVSRETLFRYIKVNLKPYVFLLKIEKMGDIVKFITMK